MKKFIITVVIVFSAFFAFNFAFINAQTGSETASQNDFLQQYLQSKQQQQAQQAQSQQNQQTQNTNTPTKSGLNTTEKILLVIYSITLLLAWTNLVLGIIALVRWLRQKKGQAAVMEKRLM